MGSWLKNVNIGLPIVVNQTEIISVQGFHRDLKKSNQPGHKTYQILALLQPLSTRWCWRRSTCRCGTTPTATGPCKPSSGRPTPCRRRPSVLEPKAETLAMWVIDMLKWIQSQIAWLGIDTLNHSFFCNALIFFFIRWFSFDFSGSWDLVVKVTYWLRGKIWTE